MAIAAVESGSVDGRHGVREEVGDVLFMAAQVAQSVVLYIDPSVDIPEGSKITVTQNGVTRDYERSGKSAVYSCHQEVPLELFKEWA